MPSDPLTKGAFSQNILSGFKAFWMLDSLSLYVLGTLNNLDADVNEDGCRVFFTSPQFPFFCLYD